MWQNCMPHRMDCMRSHSQAHADSLWNAPEPASQFAGKPSSHAIVQRNVDCNQKVSCFVFLKATRTIASLEIAGHQIYRGCEFFHRGKTASWKPTLWTSSYSCKKKCSTSMLRLVMSKGHYQKNADRPSAARSKLWS